MNFNSFLQLTFIFLSILHYSCKHKQASFLPNEYVKYDQGNLFDTSKVVRFEMDCSIRAIAAQDANTLWYTGTRGQYGHTEDGGKSWIIDSLKHPSHNSLQFRSIALTSKSVFILSIGSPALLYKSDDKGKNWDVVYQENDSLVFYDAMAFWDDNEGIAMGDPTNGCLSVIKTTDGGNSWNKISCDNLPPSINGEAAFAASNSNISLYGNNVWIVSGGMKARVFHSNNRGDTWNVYETPIVQGSQMTGIFSCDFYDEKRGIIIGGDWNNQSMNKNNKAVTYDGGKTWSLIADGQDPGYRSCVKYLDKNNGEQLIAVGIPGISHSSDGGKSWTQISQEDFYTVQRAENVLWLAGNNKISKVKLLQSTQ